MSRRRLLLLITEDWYFWSHRRPIADAARRAGYHVLLATRVQDREKAIRDLGVELIPIRLRRAGRNPWNELRAVVQLARIYRREKPTVAHHVGVKPMLYGTCAAWLAGVPHVVNAQAGLGHVFMAPGWRSALRRRIVESTYRAAWAGERTRVVFQNPDDLEFFVRRGLVSRERSVLIRGCGVDPNEFTLQPEPVGTPIVMLAGRLLWSKGVREVVEAARILKHNRVRCELALVGKPDGDNPNAVPEADLRRWNEEGVVQWWGHRTDMPRVLGQAAIVVLPSYYGEGLPKVLVEAAAVGRPLIATDAPGCREIVRNDVNGRLVPARDVPALVAAITELIADPSRRAAMGRRGREMVLQHFSSRALAQQTVDLYERLCGAVAA